MLRRHSGLIVLFCFLPFASWADPFRWYSYQQLPANCSEQPVYIFDNNRVSPPSCFVWLNEGSEPKPTGLRGLFNGLFNANKDDDTFADSKRWVASEGPWWIDPNHEQLVGGTGYGLVNVIAFSRIYELHDGVAVESQTDLSGKVVTFSTNNSDMHMVPANSRAGLQPSHIYFWVQSAPRQIDDCTPNPQIGENCTRQSDYILTAQGAQSVIFDGNGHAEHEIHFETFTSEDWTCLGAGRNVKYECAPVDDVLQRVAVLGFLAAPVNGCITNKPWQERGVCNIRQNNRFHEHVFNSGTFRFRDFTLQISQ